MRSPFPGMDPYLELSRLWGDFHDDLIHSLKRGLQSVLSRRYFVDTGQRSYVVPRSRDGTGHQPQSGAARRTFINEPYRENFLEVWVRGDTRRLVTCVEVLSPMNKRRDTEGYNLYLRKRNALLLGSANFVEIDLLRRGDRMPMVEPWPDSPYYVLVSRRTSALSCRVWPADFRTPLPDLPVPLADPDPDVVLPLQEIVNEIFDRCRYDTRIDYTRPHDAPASSV